jgi:hypothetical protein
VGEWEERGTKIFPKFNPISVHASCNARLPSLRFLRKGERKQLYVSGSKFSDTSTLAQIHVDDGWIFETPS